MATGMDTIMVGTTDTTAPHATGMVQDTATDMAMDITTQIIGTMIFIMDPESQVPVAVQIPQAITWMMP